MELQEPYRFATLAKLRNHGSYYIRIAIIGSRGLLSEYSGIEATLREICPRLARRGHALTVFGERCAERCYDGVRLEYAPSIGGKHTETLSRSLLATCRALRRFDVIHFQDVAPAVYSPIARQWGIPTVLTLHSLDWRRDKWSPAARLSIKAIEKVSVRSVDRITAVSEPLCVYLMDQYGRSSTLLPNVVEARSPVAPTAFSSELGVTSGRYVLFVGRLTREKAVHLLIDAFQSLYTDVRLVIAGGSRYDDRYADELRATAKQPAVIFAGHVSGARLQELYSNAFLFVLPSHVEGCSMALLEAMAYGTPALVSDIPENLYTIEGNGFTFRAGNVDDLAGRIAELIAKPGSVEEMRGRLLARHDTARSWDAVVAGYESVYQNAVKLKN